MENYGYGTHITSSGSFCASKDEVNKWKDELKWPSYLLNGEKEIEVCEPTNENGAPAPAAHHLMVPDRNAAGAGDIKVDRDADIFRNRLIEHVINFKIRYNDDLLDPKKRREKQEVWKDRIGGAQVGCHRHLRNLKYSLIGGRTYTLSAMMKAVAEDRFATVDVIPYLSSSSRPSTPSTVNDEDAVHWCYGSVPVPGGQRNTATPRYALGEDGEVGLIDSVRPIRLDAKTQEWKMVTWTFVAPDFLADDGAKYGIDLVNWAFIDPARVWELALFNENDIAETATSLDLSIWAPLLTESSEFIHPPAAVNLDAGFHLAIALNDDRKGTFKAMAEGEARFQVVIDHGSFAVHISNEKISFDAAALVGTGSDRGTTNLVVDIVPAVLRPQYYRITVHNDSSFSEMKEGMVKRPSVMSDGIWEVDITADRFEVFSGESTPEFVHRYTNLRGFVTNLRNDLGFSMDDDKLTNDGTLIGQGTPLRGPASFASSSVSVVENKFMSIGGYFLPPASGDYHFIVEVSGGSVENSKLWFSSSPMRKCGTLKLQEMEEEEEVSGDAQARTFKTRDPVALHGGFEYAFIAVAQASSDSGQRNLAFGVHFPNKETATTPLPRVYSVMEPQSAEGTVVANFPQHNAEKETIRVKFADETANAFYKDAFEAAPWITRYDQIKGPSQDQDGTCHARPPTQFDLIVSPKKTTELYGLVPLLDIAFETQRGNREYFVRVKDMSEQNFDQWSYSSHAYANVLESLSTSEEFILLESFFDGLPPVGSVPVDFQVSSCNAYGCTPSVPFYVGPYSTPNNLVATKVTAGHTELIWDMEAEDGEDGMTTWPHQASQPRNNVFSKMPKRFCVEIRDQTGTDWVEVQASRPDEDGPSGFIVGGLRHSTRVEFRVSAVGNLVDWARGWEATDVGAARPFPRSNGLANRPSLKYGSCVHFEATETSGARQSVACGRQQVGRCRPYLVDNSV